MIGSGGQFYFLTQSRRQANHIHEPIGNSVPDVLMGSIAVLTVCDRLEAA